MINEATTESNSGPLTTLDSDWKPDLAFRCYTDGNAHRIVVRDPDDVADTAEDWFDWYQEAGLTPILLPARSKDAVGSLNLLDGNGVLLDVDEPWSEESVGVVTGEDAGDLFDVVLCCPEAIKLAPDFLTPTMRIHGRKDSPKQHWWYQGSPMPATQTFRDANGNPLVEIRAEGCVTLSPHSVHESGDPLVWHTEIPVSPLDCCRGTPEECVRNLAATALLRRSLSQKCWGVDIGPAIAETLLRNGKSRDFIIHVVEAFTRATGCDARVVHATVLFLAAAERSLRDRPSTNPTFADILGERDAELFFKWLGLNPTRIGTSKERFDEIDTFVDDLRSTTAREYDEFMAYVTQLVDTYYPSRRWETAVNRPDSSSSATLWH